jgi:FlaA1/EpsC-like NDP-sugar epimerase
MKKVVIIGAGEAGRMILREIQRDPGLERRVVGFLDDEPTIQGGSVEGVPVLGPTSELVDAGRGAGADEAILAVPTASGPFVRRMVTTCARAGLPLRIVPGVREIITGEAHYSQVREVRAEDLLGRESVDFREGPIRDLLRGKRVLVTGAGGSIGAELCRVLGGFEPDQLHLLGRGENSIFEIEDELGYRFPGLDLHSHIADVRDAGRLGRILAAASPHLVYHAAAHKHVGYMENAPEEAVKNNVGGTLNVVEAARGAEVERVVMLSSDKAANPRGVMGATKRIAEYLLRELSGREGYPSLLSVRFGNVLGSRGSVVPLFLRQIRRGGPVTVSHREARRFFMTQREAAMLVIEASVKGEGGEIYILQMGEAMGIDELARNLISMSGYEPDEDIEVVYSGLKPGEKLTEDLLSVSETVQPSFDEKIVRARPSLPRGLRILEETRALLDLAERGDPAAVLERLERIIPDYVAGAGAGREAR